MTQPHQAEPVLLSFQRSADGKDRSGNLSAVVEVSGDLWLGSDEGTRLDRLSPLAPDEYGRHLAPDLAEVLDLPGESEEEIDVEGLAADDGFLWIAGSHSVRRPGPEVGADDEAKQVRRLARTRRGGNQHLLARVPLVATGGNGPGWARKAPQGRAARLPGGRRRNGLTDALRDDRHLAPFLDLPGKDNGFNVEGLACGDGRMFLGLRGPVLTGWAVILLLSPEPDPDDAGSLRLAPVGGRKRVYRKIFLDLHGLGIRDLVFDAGSLLILAGPTMPLDGDAVVLRWRDAFAADDDALVSRDRLERILDLPYGAGGEEGVDHPEGMALLREGERRSLLVVYDSPSDRRRAGQAGILADRFRL
jgi:hypothetical protein